jgi:hypothetical protein
MGASVVLRRVTSLELIVKDERVIWLPTATVFLLGGGTVSAVQCSVFS